MLSERVIEWTKEWKQQGLEEGRQEGRQEGEMAVILRLLEHRFGPLNESDRERIRTTDAESLLLWSERLLTVQTLDEFFEE